MLRAFWGRGNSMKYQTAIILLASTLALTGCVASEPTTYGIQDRQWQAMSHEERKIAKNSYAEKQRAADHILVANNQPATKNLLVLHSVPDNGEKVENDTQDKADKDKPQEQVAVLMPAALVDKDMNMQAAIIDQDIILQQNDPQVEIASNQLFTKEDAANLEQANTRNSKISMSSLAVNATDLEEQHLVRGNELISNLQSKLGRQPMLGEMQKELQANMSISPRQARRLIDALGFY